MPLRGATPITFRSLGVCDAIDGSNAPPGAMASLKNLIPNPRNVQQYVPRPASVQVSAFGGFSTPAKGNALIVIGNLAFGMIASARNAGKDEPFCYDLDAAAFITIGNVTNANSPTSPATSGEWEPPSMCQVGNRILITHPGYPGGATKFGWIDMRSFTSNTITGTTVLGSPTINALSASPLTAGWAVGDAISGAGIPASSYIVSMTATTVTLNQNCTAGAAGVALTVTSGTPAAPIYGAGDTNTSNLVARPVWVAQFNGRAYFCVNNGVAYTDSLKPWERTASTQALTLGDKVAATCIGGMPLTTQVSGGVIQCLIVFKGVEPYWQITGDPATSDLRVDQVAGTVGTLAPLTVQATSKGIAYISPDGLRLIDPASAICSEPIGAFGQGVAEPFILAVNPSRMCAAFNKNIYRVSVQDGSQDSQPTVEFWYHFALQSFTGPHDFPASVIAPCFTTETDFILFASGIDAKLWEHTVTPSAGSTYTENSAVMTWMWTTSLLPENSTGNSNHVVESTWGLKLPNEQTFTVQALDESDNQLDAITINGLGSGDAIWNSFVWGTGVWGGAVSAFQQWTMPWNNALDFKQMSITAYGNSNDGLVIGNLIAKVQATGFQGGHP